MGDNKGSSGTAPAGEAKTREARSNVAIATAHPITNVQSAQDYVNAVLTATRNDKEQRMFNGAGFTTPGILARESSDNLLRLAVCTIAALAGQVAQDGDAGTAASTALGIVGEFTSAASVLQEETRRRTTLLSAARAMNIKGNDTEAVETLLKGQGTSWAAVQASIRKSAGRQPVAAH